MIEFLQQNWPLVLGLVVIAAVMLKGPVLQKWFGIGSVDPAGAVRLVNRENAQVVDVREDREWREGHIPGAIHLPLSQLDKDLDRLAPYREQEKPLVLVCRSGSRSVTAAVRLRRAGFDSVYNLSGGATAWKQAGMPLES